MQYIVSVLMELNRIW